MQAIAGGRAAQKSEQINGSSLPQFGYKEGCDEITGDDEEDIDADETAGESFQSDMKADDADDRGGPETIKIGAIVGVC
jgi:hypothetical protein